MYRLLNQMHNISHSRLRGLGLTLTAWRWGVLTWPALPATGARCPQRRPSSTPCPRARSSRWISNVPLYISSHICLISGCCTSWLWAQDLWSEKWSGLQAGRHNQVSISRSWHFHEYFVCCLWIIRWQQAVSVMESVWLQGRRGEYQCTDIIMIAFRNSSILKQNVNQKSSIHDVRSEM